MSTITPIEFTADLDTNKLEDAILNCFVNTNEFIDVELFYGTIQERFEDMGDEFDASGSEGSRFLLKKLELIEAPILNLKIGSIKYLKNKDNDNNQRDKKFVLGSCIRALEILEEFKESAKKAYRED